MHVLITGGSGFLGARLARQLLAAGSLALDGAPPQPLSRLTLSDLVPPPADLLADPRVQPVTGELNALLADGVLPAPGTQLIVHLAAAVSGECEADLDLGLRSNLDATLALLQGARRLAHPLSDLPVVASPIVEVGGGDHLARVFVQLQSTEIDSLLRVRFEELHFARLRIHPVNGGEIDIPLIG